MKIGRHEIGPGHPAFLIAELSCNHLQDWGRMVALVHAAKDTGADAVKFQHYTPAIMGNQDRRIVGGPWDGRTFGELYGKTMMPWGWTGELVALCRELGMTWFSSVYDPSAVEFLEPFAPAAYKVSAFESGDYELFRRIKYGTTRPLIASVNQDTSWNRGPMLADIRLYCVSAYPTPPGAVDLGGHASWHHLSGLSDHTSGIGVPIAAVVYGAHVIEKHFTLDDTPTPDSAFSLQPDMFRAMVDAIRDAEAAMGPCPLEDVETSSRQFRRAPGGARGSYVGQ